MLPAQHYYQKGIVFHGLYQYEKAIASFDKAIEIKPDFYEAYLERGIVCHDCGLYKKAIASFDKALEIKPDFYAAQVNKMSSLCALDEETIAFCRQALEINPDLHEVWHNQGVALDNLGRYEEANACFNKALEIEQRLSV